MEHKLLKRIFVCSSLGLGLLGPAMHVESVASAATAQTLEMDITVAPGLVPKHVAIGVTSILDLADRTGVEATVSNVGVGSTTVGASAATKDVWSQPNVFVRSSGVVNGAVVTGGTVTLQNGAAITGGKTEGASFANPATKVMTVDWPTTALQYVSLEPRQTGSLTPGVNYGSVTIKTGCTLSLTGGKYFIQYLDLEPGATVVLDDSQQAVQLFVTANVIFRSNVVNLAGTAPNFMLAYLGTNAVSIEAQFRGLLLAPNAPVTLATVTPRQHEGQFFAKSVTVNPDMKVVFRQSPLLNDSIGYPTVTSGSSQPDCKSNLKLAGLANTQDGPRWTSISSGTPNNGCPTVNLCDANFNPIAVADINASLAKSETTVACSSFGKQYLNGNCPLEPNSVRNVACNGNDAACNTTIGEQCLKTCDGNSCETMKWACALPGKCQDWSLGNDPKGCSQSEIWNCDTESGNPSDADILGPTHQFTESEMIQPPSDAKTTPPEYAKLSAIFCENLSITNDGKDGQAYQQPGGDLFKGTGDSAGASKPVVLGSSSKFGLYAFPNVYHAYNVKTGRLDHYSVNVEAQGSLVAGAKILGKSITALDVNAHAKVTECGVDTAGYFKFFGDAIAELPGVNGVSTDCLTAEAAMNSAVQVMMQDMVIARQTLAMIESGADPKKVCAQMSSVVLFPYNFCQDFTGTLNDLKGYANGLVDAYSRRAQEYVTKRKAFINSTTDKSKAASELSTSLVKNPFTLFSESASIPIGPVDIVIAGSLTGEWGLAGGVYYNLARGWDSNYQPTGTTGFKAGARLTPYIDFDAALFVGVGFDIGFASASIGLEGQMQPLIGISVPVDVAMELSRQSKSDAEVRAAGLSSRDLANSDFAGVSFVGIPNEMTYKWQGNWQIGAAADLKTLKGQLNAAARVRFLFCSKTFRSKITDWTGYEKIIPLAGANFNAGTDGPTYDPLKITGADMGWSGDDAAYTQVAKLPNIPSIFVNTSNVPNGCIVIN